MNFIYAKPAISVLYAGTERDKYHMLKHIITDIADRIEYRIFCNYEDANSEDYEYVPKKYIYHTDFKMNLEHIMADQKRDDDNKMMLLIIDYDMVPRMCQYAWAELVATHRHYNISILYVSQSANDPRILLHNTRYTLLYGRNSIDTVRRMWLIHACIHFGSHAEFNKYLNDNISADDNKYILIDRDASNKFNVKYIYQPDEPNNYLMW